MNTVNIASANRARVEPTTLGKVEDTLPDQDSDVQPGFDEDGSPIPVRPLPVHRFPSQSSAAGSPSGAFTQVWERGEPARPVPGSTPVDHYDPMSGVHPVGSNGRRAPVVPALLGKLPWTMAANGSYWDIRDAQGAVIYAGKAAGEQGELIAQMTIKAVNSSMESSEPAQEVIPANIPFKQIRELELDKHIDDINELINTYGGEKVSAVLRYIRDMGIKPVEPLEYIRGELKLSSGKSKKPRKVKSIGKSNKPERTAEENRHIEIIIKSYITASKTLDKDLYKKEVIRKAALNMWNAGIRPEHIELYGKENAYWTGKWDSMRDGIVRWLDKNHSDWKPTEGKADNVLDLPAEFYKSLTPAVGATGGGQ
jgi:hypothetical protein